MLLAMYLMLLLVAFTVAAPPQYVNPDYEPSYDDDVEVEEDVVAVPPEEEFDIVVHRVARQVPKCYWDGTAPFCAGECPDGWKAVAYDSSGDGSKCWTGMKAYCCPDTSYSVLSESMFSK